MTKQNQCEKHKYIYNSPTIIPTIKAIDVSCGWGHTMILAMDGKIFCFGNNDYGQIGTQKIINVNTNSVKYPTQVIGDINNKICVKVKASTYNSYALTKDGKVYAWGFNEFYQVGIDYATNESDENIGIPTLIDLLSHESICDISAGLFYEYINMCLNIKKWFQQSRGSI